jgi:IPT/TIG domain
VALPVITSIAPITGPAAGGTIVTLTGTGFTGALAVGFGSTNASALSVMSDTMMVAVSPPGTGVVNVTVVTPSGLSAINAAVQFSYSGAPSSDSTGYYLDPALSTQIVTTLVNLIQTNNSPDAIAAQSILMRRLALEGDVVGSRIPPPKNISEIGGYINLLSTLDEAAMREQTLAGILGVAGPSPALGFLSAQPLSMVSLANDRPAGAWQASLPLSVLVRSDFSPAFLSAMNSLHAQGATLPCAGPTTLALPPGGPGSVLPSDLLLYTGRVLMLAGSAALSTTPTTDPLALVKPAGNAPPFAIAANVLSSGTVVVTPGSYDVLQASGGNTVTTTPNVTMTLVLLAPALASVGFYPASPLLTPANTTDFGWTRLTNMTGLVTGTTVYGDELALLYPPSVVAASALAPVLGYRWNGTAFAP